jgi:hypothetical protein
MQGEFDEFRIYNRVLSQREVNGNYLAGPDTLNTGAQPVGIATQPQNVTVPETYLGTFSVAASGTPPLYYQWSRNGSPIANATNADYSLNAFLADSGAIFSVVVSNFANSTPHTVTSSNATLTVVTQQAAVIQHRYNFNEAVGDVTLHDRVGSADGAVVGNGVFTGDGKLVLDGIASYVNLPNNLVTGITSITIEAWVQDDGSGGWARIFDFGNSTGGEDFPIGPGVNGTQYMFLSAPSGFGNLRGAYTIGGGGAPEQIVEWPGTSLPVGQLKHVVWISSEPAHTGRLFVDGVQVAENTAVTLTPDALGPTVNDWLGRSQWPDPLFKGQFDEFRIWSGAMTPAQVAASFAAGPSGGFCDLCLSIVGAPGGMVTISWPASATDFFLEATDVLGPSAIWQSVNDPPVLDGEFFRVTVSANSAAKFYRLSK